MIDWKSTHAALLATITAGGPLPDVAAALAQDVSTVGKIYDRAWANQGDTVLIESAEHAAWRVAYADSIEKLHELAATVDAKPVPSIDPNGDLKTAWTVAHNRLKSAVKTAGASASPILVRSLNSKPPAEPQKYEPAFYGPPGVLAGKWNFATRGEIELTLTNLISEAEALLA